MRTVAESLLGSVVLSGIAYALTVAIIPAFGKQLFDSGLKGKDLNKPEKLAKEIPESLGVVAGTVFLVCIILLQLSHFFTLPKTLSAAEYNAALTSICFMIFLGFADDVLNLRWRYKLVLPTVASLPLVVAYKGATTMMVPPPLDAFIGLQSIELGMLFQLYMCLLTVFCTNSINILAGINGLEAGQSLVIACAVLVYNFTQLALESSEELQLRHLFSISLMAPFAAVTFGILRFNWYPSQIFVGDCFTYFAGMTFAVVGILGHFPKTMMLFFIPQLLNFVVSLPQLLKIIPCPRHRLPKFNAATGKLEATPNLNLVNFALRLLGSMTELQLCKTLLVFQCLCCLAGLALRLSADAMLGHK